ncbi:MAG: hypothetical protein JSS11_10530 [Verrucomicrobia bacterium]|nr:hypothetical protein [Verrucomicrobiota bacterium]
MTPEAELDRLFPLGPDSLPQPGVPSGRLEKYTHNNSAIYPGTVRDYWVYIPAAHDPVQPAPVTIVQDGWAHLQPERRWRMATVLDNLIHQRAIPACIGIFINPGVIPAGQPGAPERTQRSFEYDSPDDRYARFLIDEILPAVHARYPLASDPGSRLIMGGSSGAFCAFNAAWHRPDAFGRVCSIVGSYVNLRGGHHTPNLVRLTEPKHLRIFLEGGGEDLIVYAGDWWTANTVMLAALTYSGYAVNHAWAPQAGHNDYHGSSIFPAALRWLWQDYPQPLRVGANSRQPIVSLTVPGESWRRAADLDRVEHLASGAGGEIYFTREFDARLHRLSHDGRTSVVATTAASLGALAVAADGRIFATQPALHRVVVLAPDGRTLAVIDDLTADSLAPAADGSLYALSSERRTLALIQPDGRRTALPLPTERPHRLALTADGSQLIVTETTGDRAWQISVQPDGTLAHPEPCYRFEPNGTPAQPPGDLATHPKRWSFFVTRQGLQLADHDGRIIGLFTSPSPAPLGGIALAGTSDLYVTCGGRIYRRPLRNPEHLWQ